MGYNTAFSGVLSFVTVPTEIQLAYLTSMLREDCRDHPDWNAPDLYYINLKLTDDSLGIKWNGAEKTYGLDTAVNVVLCEMRKKWPDFGLVGTLVAQGQSVEDRWTLTIGNDGLAHKLPLVPTGKIITCPHCRGRFELES